MRASNKPDHWFRQSFSAPTKQEQSKGRMSIAENLSKMSHNSIKAALRAGLSHEDRVPIWMNLSGANTLKEAHMPSYFQSLLHRLHSDPMFFTEPAKSRGFSKPLMSTTHIVQAYCLHSHCSPERNMYVIANFLISVTGMDDAEDAFWLLAAVFSNILTASFTDQELVGHRGYLEGQVLAALTEKRMPKLCTAWRAMSFSLGTETSSWFANLYIGILPNQTVVRIWDTLLFEGPKVLYRVGLALLKRQEQSMSHMPSRIMNMTWHISRMNDADSLMKEAFKGIGSFPGAEVRRLQTICEPEARRSQTSPAKRLEALLCPPAKTLQKSSVDSTSTSSSHETFATKS